MNYWKRQSFDTIRGLTQERLTGQIESYNNGYLADFALTAEAMEQRDDVLKNVIAKRKKAVTRHGWEVLAENCSAEARAQQEALDYFYRNLTATHVLRKDETGGFQLLIYQMLDSLAKGYAVDEILWQPRISPTLNRNPNLNPAPLKDNHHASRSDDPYFSNLKSKIKNQKYFLTAQFRFVPLWYFESTTGHLRFLSTPGALLGEEIRERDWLITLGDALMIPCARAFLFKHTPLQSWLDYTSTYGLPGIRGITGALRGTPEFAQMEEALAKFMQELSVVTNSAESIDVLDLKGSGEAPFARLVDRMDRVMASLWRGADLSTISRDQGYGASLQEQESRLLEQDDARALSDHLHATIDRWVIDALFGERTEILARIKILVSPQECTPHDLQIDEFLLRNGARLSLSDTLERYGRVQAKPDEPFLGNPPASSGALSSIPPEPKQHPAPNTPNRRVTDGQNPFVVPPLGGLRVRTTTDNQPLTTNH